LSFSFFFSFFIWARYSFQAVTQELPNPRINPGTYTQLPRPYLSARWLHTSRQSTGGTVRDSPSWVRRETCFMISGHFPAMFLPPEKNSVPGRMPYSIIFRAGRKDSFSLIFFRGFQDFSAYFHNQHQSRRPGKHPCGTEQAQSYVDGQSHHERVDPDALS